MFNQITKFALVAVMSVGFVGCAGSGAGKGGPGLAETTVAMKPFLRDASKIKGAAFESKFNDLTNYASFVDMLK
jgi:hypothetical protein